MVDFITAAEIAMFEFHPERFMQAHVSIGVVVMLVGLVIMFCSGLIARIPPLMRWEDEAPESRSVELLAKGLGTVIAIGGALIAIF